jgi:hypothetical protein
VDERDTLYCERFRCRLMVSACLTRHTATWPSGRRAGHPRFRPCDRCAQGAAVLAACPTFEPPPPSQPAEVMKPAQRAARARYKLEHLDEPPAHDLSPIAEASLAVPDDRGLDWSP